MTGRLTQISDYFHLSVETESGTVEHWLLTPNEVVRVRERGAKNVLARPRPTRWQRWVHRLRKML